MSMSSQDKEAYTRESGVVSRSVLAAMLGSPVFRKYRTLVKASGKRFVVSLRCMDTPERLVVHKEPVTTLANWLTFFEKDLLSTSVGAKGFNPPVLREFERFYTTSFRGADRKAFKVYVCPVMPTEIRTVRDVVTMFVVGPEMPRDDVSRYHDEHYASDLYCKMVCNRFCDEKVDGLLFEPGTGSTRSAECEDIWSDVGDAFRFSFESAVSKERNCGDRTIPQMLSRLWFLRGTITADAEYSVVQLNEAAYIGVFKNISGFRVFFQVNCYMSLPLLAGFLQVPLRVSRVERGPYGTYPPRSSGTVQELKLEVARCNGMRGWVISAAENSPIAGTDRTGKGDGPTVDDLWARVTGVADMRLVSSAGSLKEVLDQRAREDLAYTVQLIVRQLTPGTERMKFSAGAKGQNCLRTLNGKYYLMCELMARASDEELRDVVEMLSMENIYSITEGVNPLDIWRAMQGEITKESVDLLGDSLVPAVLPSKAELVVYLAQIPGILSETDEIELFGGTAEWIEHESDYLALNLTPDAPTPGSGSLIDQVIDEGVQMYKQEFIAWILSRVPQWVNVKMKPEVKAAYAVKLKQILADGLS